jgi:hypothetical protein
LRILTDFDGVLTTQDAEAAAVGARLLERVAEALSGDRIRALALVEGLRGEIRADPAAHGWFDGGEISCFADEDPYVFHVATAFALWRKGPAEVRERLRAAGIDSAEALAARSFDEGTAAWRAKNPSHVRQDALGALQTFFSTGAEVVIVSNSSTERIRSLLEPTGLLRWGAGKLRIRGGARKFAVGGDRPKGVPASVDLCGRKVALRRGPFYDILEDERPDVAIGDVFSLDLALPVALREGVADFEDMDVILARHASTPKWTLEACAAKGVRIVNALAEVPELLRV